MCDALNEFRFIYFRDFAKSKIGVLSTFNAFAFTHPAEITQVTENWLFDVRTTLGWTLAG